jgi:adenylate cyclase class 2
MHEVEIKLSIGPVEPEVQALLDLGAEMIQPREYEENELFDLPGTPLDRRGAMLRVRRFAGMGSLTYKEPSHGPAGYKVRREIEASVSEPRLVSGALRAAGFTTVWRYAKYRTVLRSGELHVMVDETPIGNYLELEGPPEAIDTFAERLGRSPADYILSSYWGLYDQWCRERNLPRADMLFEKGASL